MKNRKKFLEIQRKLMEEVQKKLPENRVWADEIAELFEVSVSSMYRRIRGEQLLSLDEICALCQRFDISFDALMNVKTPRQFDCVYSPVNSAIYQEYQDYISSLFQNFERIKASESSSILLSAADIPLFHLLACDELRFFNLFTYANSVYDYEGSMEEFLEEMKTPEIVHYHHQISDAYEHIPSTEIWTNNTLVPTLKLISYYLGLCRFTDKELPLLLCEQLLNILNKLQKWVENCSKDDGNTPFGLYWSDMEPDNTYILLNHGEYSNCIVKLFTINHLNVYEHAFCRETEIWLTKLSKRAVLLSGSSERDKVKFFNTQRHKVKSLIETINAHFE
ncbi:MAG: hypothetical protein FWG54_02180 [Bacteroidetes bacterium]|nr:hypothetical protein [Bacteroidota bacterium]